MDAKKLKLLIEEKRKELDKLILSTNNLVSYNVIKISKEPDELIALYIYLSNKENKK